MFRQEAPQLQKVLEAQRPRKVTSCQDDPVQRPAWPAGAAWGL